MGMDIGLILRNAGIAQRGSYEKTDFRFCD